jgi:hypothetical protein
MPTVPMHATVPTSASAAFPPFSNRSVPIFEQMLASDATAPVLPVAVIGPAATF